MRRIRACQSVQPLPKRGAFATPDGSSFPLELRDPSKTFPAVHEARGPHAGASQHYSDAARKRKEQIQPPNHEGHDSDDGIHNDAVDTSR